MLTLVALSLLATLAERHESDGTPLSPRPQRRHEHRREARRLPRRAAEPMEIGVPAIAGGSSAVVSEWSLAAFERAI